MISNNDHLQQQVLISLTNGLQHGEYYLGPPLALVSPCPVKRIEEHLAKDVNTSEFVTMKILNFSSPSGIGLEDNKGKVLLHNEHSVLSILQDTPGVIRHHGLYKESQRIILVLSCVYRHDYDHQKKYQDLVNLQHYIIQQKYLCEREALRLFFLIVKTVGSIHQKNIVHRDLKLGNVVLNKRTQEVTITNFGLSKHMVRDSDLLTDQRGSLAYVSPDILSGEPYSGKPCDMWSLGVLLYTMLFGQFPFYDDNPQDLFRKIRNAKFTIPRNVEVSSETTFLLSQLIEPDPRLRLTVTEVIDSTQSIYSRLSLHLHLEPMQIVPEVDSNGNPSDGMVPTIDRAPPTSPPSNVDMVELSAPRLTLNPFINTDSPAHYYRTPSPLTHSPSSPASPHIIFFSDSAHSRPPSTNPFTNPPSLSLPPHPSLSPNPSSHVTYNPTNSLPIYLVPTNEISEHTPSPPTQLDYAPPTSIHMHLHPAHYMTTRHAHRHSFSEGDGSQNPALLTPNVRPIAHGRRSLGSMLGTRPQRRNSHHNAPSPNYSMFNTSEEPQQRTRRRSHEPRDNEREILQSLQAVANRTCRPHSAGNTPH